MAAVEDGADGIAGAETEVEAEAEVEAQAEEVEPEKLPSEGAAGGGAGIMPSCIGLVPPFPSGGWWVADA